MAIPISSGTASITANSATPTTLIAAGAMAGGVAAYGQIANAGAVEASYSVDGGTTYICLPPTSAQALPPGNYANGIKVQGNGGTATGLSAVLWQGSVP